MKLHGLSACQLVYQDDDEGRIHGETDLFPIGRLNLRCGVQENINSRNDLGSHGRWHIPVVAVVDTPSKSYSAVSTVGMLRILSATA